MRGEKLDLLRCAVVHRGSPPHARGKDSYITDEDDKSGITPACAGKKMLPGLLRRRAGDHPRMRGEKLLKPKNL